MLVPLSWLRDYVDITIPVEELAHRLTLAGLEVGNIEYIGLPADPEMAKKWAMPVSTDHLVWDREKIVLGHILEVKSHPDADRLVLAMVDSGIGEVETVVTGAPNLYPYKDQGPIDPPLVVAYARENAEVIDGHKDDGSRLVIKPKKLRGIDNKSMVCSEKELGLSNEHEGIMILESDAAPGTPLQDVLGDVILDIDLTPNLARCFSMFGVAREVAALTGQKVNYPSLDVVAEGDTIDDQLTLEITRPDLNPRFVAALIKGITIKPSPQWVQRRLKLAGMRPINNIVDVTNYVMLEVGEPLHAFDYDILVERAGGKAPTIITRTAEPGEKLTTLDDVEHDLDPFTELVADTAGSLSIAGIMGGAESEVHKESVNVLLEGANWNFINVRQTLSAQRERGTEMVTEAGTRFSRVVHPEQARVGVVRAIELMRQLAGGTVAKGIADAYPALAPVITVDLPLSEVERALGIALTQDEIADILVGLEFGVEKVDEQSLLVTVPDHRMDIGFVNEPEHEDIADMIAHADLIEEIARIYGYDRIPNTLIEDALPPQRENTALIREEMVRDLLINAGLQEIVTYRLTTPEAEARLTPAGAKSDWPELRYITLANPISQDKVVMRHTLLSGVLDILVANARWRDRLLMFEVGKVYLPVDGENLPDEPGRLCIVMTGKRDTPSWQETSSESVMDFYDLKGVVETLVGGLHLADVRFEPVEHSTFFPGRTARLVIEDRDAGVLGELHPLVCETYELPEQPVLVAELNLDVLQDAMGKGHAIRSISNFPAIYQDVAIVVDEDIPAVEVETTIREAGGSLLRGVRLFDVYQGEQIGAGKKSLAYALTFQSDEKTLRDKDADKVRTKIVKMLEKNFGAKLRA
ncbi:MAG: phenylalanine--tRNA ligase subunit beta [Anaerolineae bacterium]|nr:phenylalanine--tRNA ligase subunit beta [Anaerolineae bacterium]